MIRPNDTDKCDTCKHTFAIHYVSMDGRVMGCLYSVDDQRDPYKCDCKGFAIIWRYTASDPVSTGVYKRADGTDPKDYYDK